MLFSLRSKFILATDDGSRADKLNQIIGNKKNTFYYWKNGVQIEIGAIAKLVDSGAFLFYPSRIAEKKQQVEAVKLLHSLRQKGNDKLSLILVGHISDQQYFDEVFCYAKYLGVEKQVVYKGLMEKDELLSYMKHAQAVVSFQKVSNLGNVLIEALSCESLVVSYDEPALSEFLVHGESAILISEIDEAANILNKIFSDSEMNYKIRKNSKVALLSMFDDWDKRVRSEIELIFK